MIQATYKLSARQFISAIISTSLLHAISFALLSALFISVLFMNSLASAVAVPLLVTAYITSYALHELGHYCIALKLQAQPVVWIDHRAVSIISQPRSSSAGRLIALAGPLTAMAWIMCCWGLFSFTLPAYRFAALIPALLLASAHLGNLLPVCSDGKAVWQVRKSLKGAI